jgi:hypothetical protein
LQSSSQVFIYIVHVKTKVPPKRKAVGLNNAMQVIIIACYDLSIQVRATYSNYAKMLSSYSAKHNRARESINRQQPFPDECYSEGNKSWIGARMPARKFGDGKCPRQSGARDQNSEYKQAIASLSNKRLNWVFFQEQLQLQTGELIEAEGNGPDFYDPAPPMFEDDGEIGAIINLIDLMMNCGHCD